MYGISYVDWRTFERKCLESVFDTKEEAQEYCNSLNKIIPCAKAFVIE